MEKEDKLNDRGEKGKFIDPKPLITSQTYTVKAGDTLSAIAEKFYGKDSESTYQDIYESNKDLIGDNPDQIKIGIVLKIPRKK